jgi:lipopolysaccharide transport system permease protein
MLLGILNVFFRDVGQMFGICLQFWFWLTPIVYPLSILPEWDPALAATQPADGNLIDQLPECLPLQPMAGLESSLLPLLVIGLLFCAMALRLFRQRVGEMVDEL